MEVEVKQPNGIFLKALVKAVTPEHLLVSFDGGSKPDEKVPYENCRVVKIRDKKDSAEFKTGDFVEAHVKQPNSEMQGWQKMKIRDIKVDCFFVLEKDVGVAVFKKIYW